MIAWIAVVRVGDEPRVVVVTGRNRFEALKAAVEMLGPDCHVLKLKRSVELIK